MSFFSWLARLFGGGKPLSGTSSPTRILEVHRGKASSFADLADVRAFRRCKAQGKSDVECFKVGDNGVGCYGDETSQTHTAMCAIPPDDMIDRWESIANAKHKKIRVVVRGRSVVAIVADRMPWEKNIKNGAIIDLNPAAANALGLVPPFMVDCEWSWV